MLQYTLYTFLFKRRSAKYRLPTEIYSPLRRIWTLKADGLTTHRERSLSVHCLHSSVLFFIIFRHRCILLFNFPYHTLPIRETEDTMPVKFFGQAFSINPFQCFCYHPFYVFGKQAVEKPLVNIKNGVAGAKPPTGSRGGSPSNIAPFLGKGVWG